MVLADGAAAAALVARSVRARKTGGLGSLPDDSDGKRCPDGGLPPLTFVGSRLTMAPVRRRGLDRRLSNGLHTVEDPPFHEIDARRTGRESGAADGDRAAGEPGRLRPPGRAEAGAADCRRSPSSRCARRMPRASSTRKGRPGPSTM